LTYFNSPEIKQRYPGLFKTNFTELLEKLEQTQLLFYFPVIEPYRGLSKSECIIKAKQELQRPEQLKYTYYYDHFDELKNRVLDAYAASNFESLYDYYLNLENIVLDEVHAHDFTIIGYDTHRNLIKDEICLSMSRKCSSQGFYPFDNKEFDELAKLAAKEGIILSANTGRIAQAERQCLNARIQGSAVSLTKLAMIQIHNSQELKDLDAKLVMTIHDEVMLECPALYAEQASEILPRIMIDAAAPYIDVPMKCDPAIESRWYTSEYAVVVQEEFKKLTDKGLDRDTAFVKLYEKHPELPEEAIYKTITEGIDLEF
jgi:hypothetical protein